MPALASAFLRLDAIASWRGAQYHLEKLFSRDELDRDRDKAEGDKHADKELADLNLYLLPRLPG